MKKEETTVIKKTIAKCDVCGKDIPDGDFCEDHLNYEEGWGMYGEERNWNRVIFEHHGDLNKEFRIDMCKDCMKKALKKALEKLEKCRSTAGKQEQEHSEDIMTQSKLADIKD